MFEKCVCVFACTQEPRIRYFAHKRYPAKTGDATAETLGIAHNITHPRQVPARVAPPV